MPTNKQNIFNIDTFHNVVINTIDNEARGITKINGKTVFIPDTLPTEEVEIQLVKKKSNYDIAKLIKINKKSIDRVEPNCPNFGYCGGCSMQHINLNAQLKYKEQTLLDNLKYIGKTTPINILSPINSSPWAYRKRARLSVRYVEKKGEVLIGFREKSSSFIANMNECSILPLYISNLIPKLKLLFNKLSIKSAIPQLEIAVGTNITILVLRIMNTINEEDNKLLTEFIDNTNNTLTNNQQIQFWLQPKGPDSCYPFYPKNADQLSYEINNYAITMPFYPTEFTQVNSEVNIKMIELALKLLKPNTNETIGDFFCGIGNFTLPLAKFTKYVIGFEGSIALVERAKENAKINNINNIDYKNKNLFEIDNEYFKNIPKLDKWLIDPPRNGAIELIESLSRDIMPKVIVYVSCNTASLARDAAILTNVYGYKLTDTGVINMFPHTSHIESIARFEL